MDKYQRLANKLMYIIESRKIHKLDASCLFLTKREDIPELVGTLMLRTQANDVVRIMHSPKLECAKISIGASSLDINYFCELVLFNYDDIYYASTIAETDKEYIRSIRKKAIEINMEEIE